MNIRHSFITALLFALAVNGGLLPATAHADDDNESWYEVRTGHFVVRTNAKESRAVELATELEKYRFTVAYLSGLNTRDVPSVPVTVYAYRTMDQYLEVTGARGTAGFYLPRQDGPISVLSLEDGDEDWQLSGKRVLFHEYTHHILHQFSPISYPRWYDEGFAEYMATVEFDGDHAVIGKPALHRVPFLKRVSDWVRAFEIIDSRGRYMGHIGTSVMRDPRRGKGGQSLQYAQGWLMVHYLHSESRLQRNIPRYLQEINRADVDDEQAFREAFGMDYKKFDREVRRYWADADFAVGRVEIASRMPEVEPEVREMPAAEADAMRYEAPLAFGGTDSISKTNAAQAFVQCLEDDVRPLDMRLALVELALADKDWSSAREHVDALLAEDPNSAPGLTAGIRLARAHDNGFDREKALELRKSARRAILTEPTYVPALIQYADLTFEHDLDVDSNTASVVESIRFLAPDLDAGKIFEARLSVHRGDGDKAVAMLDEMIKWSNSDEQATRFREIREELAKDISS